VIAPKQMKGAYQQRITETRNPAPSSLVVLPLASGELTTGAIGLVKFGRKKWRPQAIDALEG
jgi:hypothetical protein